MACPRCGLDKVHEDLSADLLEQRVADVLLDWVRGEDLTLALESLRDAFRRVQKKRDESRYTPPSRQLRRMQAD